MSESRPISWGVLICATAAVGCNLVTPASEYEYVSYIEIVPDDGGMTTPDVVEEEDLPPPLPPELIITEVLIDSSDENLIRERGVYVELRNVGLGPAEPREITLTVRDGTGAEVTRIQVGRPATQEEVRVFAELRPIEPGSFFVFVHHSTADAPIADVMAPGEYFDFGRYGGASAGFSDSQERVLELRYGLEVQDSVRWRAGLLLPPDGSEEPSLPFEVNRAVGLAPGVWDAESNDSPDVWCEHETPIPGGTFFGSPGEESNCSP